MNRLLWTVAGALGLVAVVRRFPTGGSPLRIGLAGAHRVLLTPAPVLTAVALARRSRALALVGAALTADLVRDPAVSPTRSARGAVRVVTANLLYTNKRGRDVAAAIAADQPDVVLLQELTPALWTELSDTGLLDALPHRVLDPRPGHDGSAVLTRWPCREQEVLDVCGTRMASAVVETPGGPVRFVSVHTRAPLRPGWIVAWRGQLDHFARLARATGGGLVLAGDFNATRGHREFRALLAAGLRDACDLGRGPGLTWPQVPGLGLMRLDHVLVTGDIAVAAARVAPNPGSDHRRVVVELSPPGSGGVPVD